MRKKTLFSTVAFIGGLGLLIACFFLWRKETTPDDIFYLRLVVSSLVYCIFFLDLFGKWINPKDPSQKAVGSLGIKWIVVGIYCAAAILALLLFAGASFKLQLIIQLFILLLLVFGFVAVHSVSDKVADVYQEQKIAKSGIERMKKAMTAIHDKLIECGDVPADYKSRLTEIQDSLRYLSPADNPEAIEFEDRFVDVAKEIETGLPSFAMNQERLNVGLQKLERLFQQRKQLYF